MLRQIRQADTTFSISTPTESPAAFRIVSREVEHFGPDGRLRSRTMLSPDGTVISESKTIHDSAGRIANTIVRNAAGHQTDKVEYWYDDKNRITMKRSSGRSAHIMHYAYDIDLPIGPERHTLWDRAEIDGCRDGRGSLIYVRVGVDEDRIEVRDDTNCPTQLIQFQYNQRGEVVRERFLAVNSGIEIPILEITSVYESTGRKALEVRNVNGRITRALIVHENGSVVRDYQDESGLTFSKIRQSAQEDQVGNWILQTTEEWNPLTKSYRVVDQQERYLLYF